MILTTTIIIIIIIIIIMKMIKIMIKIQSSHDCVCYKYSFLSYDTAEWQTSTGIS